MPLPERQSLGFLLCFLLVPNRLVFAPAGLPIAQRLRRR
jgi:hypothetical protein